MADKLKNTEDFIKKYGKQVEDEIKARLLSAGKKASGKLYRSIKFNIRESVKQLEVSWRMEDYGLYVDGGVKGAGVPKGLGFKPKDYNGNKKTVVTVGKYKFGNKMPPESSIRKWLGTKGIPKEASFPIRRSIWMFGIAPTNFWTIPTTRRQKQFEKGIEDNMAKDLDIQLQKELNKK
jgi:hypothetical protein